MSDLKRCPCGKTPTSIGTYGYPQSKWMYAVPDCCGEWNIEFRSQYLDEGPELTALAEEAWNNAPRKEEQNEEDT